MRIDPKPYTLDANERHILDLALTAFIDAKRRTRAQLKGHDDKSREAIERNEAQTARAEDLRDLLA